MIETASLAAGELSELRQISPRATEHSEGGVPYLLLPALALPPGCEPSAVDALLCPVPRDGYSSRLFFGLKVSPVGRENPSPLNWNGSVRILERNWHAHSWRTPAGLRLAQMLTLHLKALR
jgi:hypothetical protein